MITRWLFVFATLMLTTAHAAPRPRVRPTAALIESLGCEKELTRIVGAVERTLETLDARRASVYLGEFAELPELLVRAGLKPERAAQMNEAISKVRWLAFNTPNLRYPGDVLTDALLTGDLLTCVASKNCELPGPDANHLMYTGANREHIVLMPAPKVDARRFAINFWGTVSAVAGERLLIGWLRAGFNQESKRPGSADQVWRTFVSPGYRGGQPNSSNALSQGFSMAFLLLYQTHQSVTVYDLLELEGADRNYRQLAEQIIDRLYRGPAAHLTGPYVALLGLNADNVFTRMDELIDTMSKTIVADQASAAAN